MLPFSRTALAGTRIKVDWRCWGVKEEKAYVRACSDIVVVGIDDALVGTVGFVEVRLVMDTRLKYRSALMALPNTVSTTEEDP